MTWPELEDTERTRKPDTRHDLVTGNGPTRCAACRAAWTPSTAVEAVGCPGHPRAHGHRYERLHYTNVRDFGLTTDALCDEYVCSVCQHGCSCHLCAGRMQLSPNARTVYEDSLLGFVTDPYAHEKARSRTPTVFVALPGLFGSWYARTDEFQFCDGDQQAIDFRGAYQAGRRRGYGRGHVRIVRLSASTLQHLAQLAHRFEEELPAPTRPERAARRALQDRIAAARAALAH